MTRQTFRKSLFATAPLALATLLAACNSSPDAAVVAPPVAVAPAPAPAPSPTPTPTPSPASRNVTACLNQVIPGTGGATPASLVIPDTVKVDFTRPLGFPNGRQLADQVVDITLAALFLRLDGVNPEPVTRLAALPLNPGGNDLNGGVFPTTFPYLLPPQGTPPISTGTGASFNFRTDPASSFVRVDRNGMPAVAVALIGGATPADRPLKDRFNDANLSDDIAGVFVPDIVSQLTALHNALADDLIAAGFKVCST